ncbi:hypothetical protein EVAR_16653_1 [Eumeta japonica]|uniref:Uncharacterized protein n=1 Tax=Eumeta variegata TaxID=151549 RepID=A0A4C1UZH2_EUMVA|nr:hypothetical protein EVAR_16653_1 [Eumeta japonica]
MLFTPLINYQTGGTLDYEQRLPDFVVATCDLSRRLTVCDSRAPAHLHNFYARTCATFVSCDDLASKLPRWPSAGWKLLKAAVTALVTAAFNGTGPATQCALGGTERVF